MRTANCELRFWGLYLADAARAINEKIFGKREALKHEASFPSKSSRSGHSVKALAKVPSGLLSGWRLQEYCKMKDDE
jgi:hypothetical protein